MTSAPDFAQARPKLRDGVVLGAAQSLGTATVHHLKHGDTGWFYRVSPREHFLLSRMDGTRSLEELEAEYQEEFGRPIGESGWQQLFGLLWQRALIDTGDDSERIEALRVTQQESQKSAQGLMRKRFPLVTPDGFLTEAARRLRPVLRPAVVWPLAALVAGLVLLVATRVPALFSAWQDAPSYGITTVAALVTVWLAVALHELGHGLVCAHYGGRVPEIGVMWRFPLLAPYCKVDDSVLFPYRHQRVLTAFAGVFVHLTVLLPMVPVWMWSTEGTTLHAYSSAVLLIGTFGAVINLVPFLRLDGYFMLTHALGMADLRMETYRFWRKLLSAMVGRGTGVSDYSTRDKLIYGLYGGVFGIVITGVLGGIVTIWFITLRIYVGAFWSAAILIAEAMVILALISWWTRRKAGQAEA